MGRETVGVVADWRYYVTYSGRVRTDTNDENVALLAAAEQHAERNADESIVYLPHVEVEPLEGREGE